MTITNISHNQADVGATPAASLACAFAPATTQHDLLIAVVATFGTITGVTDTAGNTWVLAGTVNPGSNGKLAVYYVKDAVGGASTVTVTLSAADYITLGILEYSNPLNSGPLDLVVTGNNTDGTASTLALTSGSTAQAVELVLAAACDNSGNHHYSAPGLTSRVDLADGANSFNLAVLDHTVSTIGPQSVTLTRDAAHTFNGILLTFKANSTPTIGLDCQLLLDGSGYFIEPASFTVSRPRVRRAEHTRQAASGSVGAGERYVDMGPGKREWSFTVLAFQAMRRYDGSTSTLTGQQYRDALHTSYQKVNTTLSFTDPQGTTWTVRFDDLVEEIADVRAQGDGELQYYLHVALVEA